MKIKLILWGCLIINIILIIFLVNRFYIFYEDSKETFIYNIEKCFQSAVFQEAEKRLIDNNIPFVHNHNMKEEKPKDAMLISETDTIRIRRTEDYESQSWEAKSNMFLQTILVWEKVFIKLDDLNDIWQNILREKNIFVETGIQYRHRDFPETIYSKQRSKFFINSKKINLYSTGVIKEISLQGYYLFSPWNIIKYKIANFILIGWIFSLATLSLIIIIFKLKKLVLPINMILISKLHTLYQNRINNKNIFLILSLILCIISISILLSISINSYKKHTINCTQTINTKLKEAITIEVFKRLIDNKVPHRDVTKNPQDLTPQATLKSATDTIKVNRTPEYESQSWDEKKGMFLQTIFIRKETYIKLHDLDSIWKSKLVKENIHISTGVKYRHRDFANTLYNDVDSIFFINSLRTEGFRTGGTHEITIQGHYNLPIKSVLIYGQKDFMKLGWIGSFLLISLIGTCFGIVRVSRVKLTPLIPPPTDPEVLTIKKATIYPLNEYIELDVERGLLTTDDGREVKLKYHMVQLFEELLLSPYFHAFDTDIRLRIWFQEDEPSNVLTQLISRTREAVKPIKEIEIRNIRKRGYQLIIHPKGEKWDQVPERNHQQKTLTFD